MQEIVVKPFPSGGQYKLGVERNTKGNVVVYRLSGTKEEFAEITKDRVNVRGGSIDIQAFKVVASIVDCLDLIP